MYQFIISTQSISLIVPEVCEAIINALSGYNKVSETCNVNVLNINHIINHNLHKQYNNYKYNLLN